MGLSDDTFRDRVLQELRNFKIMRKDPMIDYEMTDEGCKALVEGKLSAKPDPAVIQGFKIQYDAMEISSSDMMIYFIWNNIRIMGISLKQWIEFTAPGNTLTLAGLEGYLPLKLSR